jgi:hypothetical protein
MMDTTDETTARRSSEAASEHGTGSRAAAAKLGTAPDNPVAPIVDVDEPQPTPQTPTPLSDHPRSRLQRVRRQSPRRTRVVVRKVSPLSVLKFSLLFYLCVMLIVLFALTIVYGVLSAAGAIESFESVLGEVFGTGVTSTGGAEPLQINGGALFAWGFVGGLVFAVVWSLINVFVALLYNLIADIIGGVEITLTDKPGG